MVLPVARHLDAQRSSSIGTVLPVLLLRWLFASAGLWPPGP